MAFILLSLLSYLWEILEGLVASRIVLLIVVSIGSVFLPTFLGWVLTTVLQKTVLHGYPMSFGAIHTSIYFSQVPDEVCERPHCWWFNVRVENFVFKNPPETATSPAFDGDFLKVENVKFTFGLDSGTIVRSLKFVARLTWTALTQIRKPKPPPLAKQVKGMPKPMEPLGEIIFYDLTFNRVSLDFALSGKSESPAVERKLPSTFNINALTTALAEGDVRSSLGECKPLPNCLRARIIRARGLKPMDVCRLSGKRSSDPYVRITARHERRWTTTAIQNLDPMWNETFSMHVPDASTVLQVEVLDEDFVKSDLIGTWIMTVKFIAVDPRHCKHNSNESFTVMKDADGYPIVRGWFRLMDSNGDTEDEAGNMTCGEIEMELNWRFSKTMHETELMRELGALDQLRMNSAETQLRLGSIPRVIHRLESIPLRFRVYRCTLRDISVNLKDMFMGFTPHERKKFRSLNSAGKERGGDGHELDDRMSFDDRDGIQIGVLYISKALRGSKNLWQLTKTFSICVLKEATARGIWSANRQIVWTSVVSVKNRVSHSWKTWATTHSTRDSTQQLQRQPSIDSNWSTDESGNDRHNHSYMSGAGFVLREFQHMPMTQQGVRGLHEHELTAEDDDFIAGATTRAGYLMRAVPFIGGSNHLSYYTYRVEIRGETLYMHAADRHGKMKKLRQVWKRISIRDLRYVWRDEQEGVLVLQGKYAVDYMRDIPPKRRSGEKALADSPSLDDWFHDIYRILSLAKSRTALHGGNFGEAAGIAHIISRCDFDDKTAAKYIKAFTEKFLNEIYEVADLKQADLVADFNMTPRHGAEFFDAVQRNIAAREMVQINRLYNGQWDYQ